MLTERALLGLILLGLAGGAFAHSDPGGFAAGEEGADGAIVRSDSSLIVLGQVEARAVTERRSAIGRVVAGTGALHDVNAFISGQLHELLVQPGMRVRRGDAVAGIVSPEFIRTQRAYLALLGNEQQLEILREEGRLSNYIADARENLRWWGMNDEDIARLEERRETIDHITVRSPVDGVITEVLASPGDLINAGDRAMAQFVVMGRAIARVLADDHSLWLEGFVLPSQLLGVQPQDTRVVVSLPGGGRMERVLHTIDAAVGERQLVRVLARLDAPAEADTDGGAAAASLYPGQPVRFELLVQRPESAWLPRAAVLGQGLETVVFVQTEAGVYERRRIHAAAAAGEWIAVSELAPGTPVVLQGKTALEGAYRLSASGGHGDDHHHH